MDEKHLLSLVRQAVDDYHMIEPNDKIAVGISGGKDSLTLLKALKTLSRFYPNPFEVSAVTVDVGFHNVAFDGMKRFCDSLEVSYHIIPTDIQEIVFESRKEPNPCSLCSKLRKGALNDYVKAQGIQKVAYAHHKDDVIETMMMSLIYEGRIHTFQPVTYLDRTGITLIRPLIYMNEADIKGYVNKEGLPVLKSACPADGNTKRETIKELIKSIDAEAPGVRKRMFSAIQSSELRGWKSDHE